MDKQSVCSTKLLVGSLVFQGRRDDDERGLELASLAIDKTVSFDSLKS
jgi:hypothetical protein